MSFSGGGNSSTSQQVQPYAAAEPALGQILSEASNLYGQGVGAAGFVAPTTQTIEGLAGQEALARQSQQQLADTLSGTLSMIGDKVFNFQRLIADERFFNSLKISFKYFSFLVAL